MYHSTIYTNKEIRKLLGNDVDRFILQNIDGKPAKTKNKIVIKGNKVTIFGSDFVAKGFLKEI